MFFALWLAVFPAFAADRKAPPPHLTLVKTAPVAAAPARAVVPFPQAQAQLKQAAGADQAPAQADPAALAAKLFDAARLTTPNPVSATTLAEAGVSAVHLDAGAAPRGQTAAVAKAVRHKGALVVGRFADARDGELKPKLDEGLGAAVLEKAESLKEVVRFLKRLYLPPMGERSVGPSEATGHLSRAKEFIATTNKTFLGGISIDTEKGAQEAWRLMQAKARGLRFVELGENLSAAAAAVVRRAAVGAGIPVVEAPRTDRQAVADAFARYGDVAPVPLPKTTEAGFLMSPDAVMARELQRGAGAVFIDAEAGPFTFAQVVEMIRAVPPGTAYVRAVEWNDPRVADYARAGAAGVIAPQIANVRQATAFVKAVKDASPAAKAILIIESKKGLDNVEDIAHRGGADVLFIGPNDLSLSLGLAQDSPEFAAVLRRIEAAAAARYLPLGGLSKSRSETRRLFLRGYRFLATVGDQPALRAFFSRP